MLFELAIDDMYKLNGKVSFSDIFGFGYFWIMGFETVCGTLKAFKKLKYNSEIDSLIETQIEYIYSYYFELFKLFNNYLTYIL